MKKQNENKNRAFLVNTENLNPIVLKHLENKGDILTLRTLQGEMAELYRLLTIQTNGTVDKFALKVELGTVSDSNEKVTLEAKGYAWSFKDKIVRDVFQKHIIDAIEELKNISLECVLEDIKEIPIDGNVEELTAAKKALEDTTRKNKPGKEKLSS